MFPQSPRRSRRATVGRRATATVTGAVSVLSALAVAVPVLTAVSATPAAAAPSPAPGGKADLPAGLYGKADPKFDGVWRQSLTLLAQDGAGAVPAKKAVDWLAGQQCADGSFTAYRADADGSGAKCDPKKTPSDINATAAAVQALAAVGGRGGAVGKAVDWLKDVQNKDGGWGYAPGGPSDANSVSVVVGALSAAGEEPEKVRKGGRSPYDALFAFQLGCDTEGVKKDQRGAFAYQPDKKGKLAPNDDATAAAVLAGHGAGLLPEPLKKDDKGDGKLSGADCDAMKKSAKSRTAPAGAADSGAAYLAAVLKRNGGHLKSLTPGEDGPDYANTADAVIALAAGGHAAEARDSLGWLRENFTKWDKSKNDPAALSSLMLASRAAGGDPAKLGGTDLLKRLNATGPAPERMPADKAEDGKGDKDDDGGSSVATWGIVVAGLAMGAGIGFLLSGRRKKQQP